VCNNSTAPSVSSINRILRNRAAERAASDYAQAATAFPFFPPFGFPPPPALQLWSGWANNSGGGQRHLGSSGNNNNNSDKAVATAQARADHHSPLDCSVGMFISSLNTTLMYSKRM
jgi:hypothetical protein